jgi:hypothetical protein
VLAVRGLVVIVPLIGWAPLQPPEAMHDCAPVARHCKIVELPLGMLAFFAVRVTAGFAVSLEAAVVVLPAVLPVEALVVDVSADDSPQAASAANTAHPSAHPNTRPTKPIPRLRDSRPWHPLPLFFFGGGVLLISTVR